MDALAPVLPNGVSINYLEVIKIPTISRTPVTMHSLETNNGTSMEFIMEVAKFRVIYSVRECGFGMGLLMGKYDGSDDARVQVSQVCNLHT